MMLLYSITQEKSGVPLVAHEKFAEPKEVEVLYNAVVLFYLMDIHDWSTQLHSNH